MNPQIPYLVAVLEGDVVIDYFFVDMYLVLRSKVSDLRLFRSSSGFEHKVRPYMMLLHNTL